jgi:hypothetical protein
MDEQLSDYRPLCDMDGCRNLQCGTPFEGYMKCRIRSIDLPVRIMPCRIHLDQLKRIAFER